MRLKSCKKTYDDVNKNLSNEVLQLKKRLAWCEAESIQSQLALQNKNEQSFEKTKS